MARRGQKSKINIERLPDQKDIWQYLGPRRICQIEDHNCGYLTAALEQDPHHVSSVFEDTRSSLPKPLTQASTTSRLTPKQLFVNGELAALLCPEARAGDFLVSMFNSELHDLHFVLRHHDGASFGIIGQAVMTNRHRIKIWNERAECTLNVHLEHTVHRADISINLSSEDKIALASQDLCIKKERDSVRCFSRLMSKVSTNSRPMTVVTDMRCTDHWLDKGDVICDEVVSSIYNIDYRNE
jgi:hypothetical protein